MKISEIKVGEAYQTRRGEIKVFDDYGNFFNIGQPGFPHGVEMIDKEGLARIIIEE